MREIKFRAWNAGNNEWMNGRDISIFLNGWVRVYDGNPFLPYEDFPKYYPLIHIMQFTGLRDKNGREIYEGDLIKHINTNFGYGDPKQPEYHVGVLRSLDYLFGDELWINICQSGEVIGNIWENPELVK